MPQQFAGFVYVACPYTHSLPAVRELRFREVSRYAADLMIQGYSVFSPISHSHHIAEYMGPAKVNDHVFWMTVDLPILERASALHVLTLPGWESSRGVTTEIEHALRFGIPVMLVCPFGRTEPMALTQTQVAA